MFYTWVRFVEVDEARDSIEGFCLFLRKAFNSGVPQGVFSLGGTFTFTSETNQNKTIPGGRMVFIQRRINVRSTS